MNNEIYCGCGNLIPIERYELGFRNCISCGEKMAQRNKPTGYMHYGHKTAGSIVITTKPGFDNYKKISYRKNKGSNMGFASRMNSTF